MFGFALKWRECTMHMQYKDCGLTVGRVRRVPTIHAILKNYRKYRQHGTSLNKNKVNSGRYLSFLVRLLSKEKLNIKALVSVDHFIPSSATYSSVNFCPILKNWVSKFKLTSCLTIDTQFSDLSVLKTNIFVYKLVYFFWDFW